MTTPLVEAIARAVAERLEAFDVNGIPQAALTAITEAGFVVCPREPTEAMTVLMAEAVEAATEIIADGNFDRPARLQALAAHAAFIDAATNNGKAE